MSVDVSFVTALRIGDKWRRRNWKVCHTSLKPLLADGAEWIVVETGSSLGARAGCKRIEMGGRYNKCVSYNVGWQAASNDIVCFLDADMAMKKSDWQRALELIQRSDVIQPFRAFARLPKLQSNAIIGDRFAINWKAADSVWKNHRQRPTACGGITLIARRVLECVHGWDERFTRWGWEDVAMNRSIYMAGYDVKHTRAWPVHLWHPGGYRSGGKEAMRQLYRSEYRYRSFSDIMERRGHAL